MVYQRLADNVKQEEKSDTRQRGGQTRRNSKNLLVTVVCCMVGYSADGNKGNRFKGQFKRVNRSQNQDAAGQEINHTNMSDFTALFRYGGRLFYAQGMEKCERMW